jgi:hypothetical protein
MTVGQIGQIRKIQLRIPKHLEARARSLRSFANFLGPLQNLCSITRCDAPASEFRMGPRPTHRDENRSESARVRSSGRGTVKVVATLDEVRPFPPSLIWNVRFEPICVQRCTVSVVVSGYQEFGKT